MKRLALLVAFIIAFTALCSCSGGADDAQILAALDSLAPKAYELYTIVYADGLPHGEIDKDGYASVSEEAKYQSVDELKTALSEVFTEDYLAVIYNTAFGGVSADEGSIGAKFGEDGDGLYVYPTATEGFAAPREFDLSGASVIKKMRFMAEVLVPHENGDVNVVLVYDDGKWLIDSPLY